MNLGDDINTRLRRTIALLALTGIVVAVVISKRRSSVIGEEASAAEPA